MQHPSALRTWIVLTLPFLWQQVPFCSCELNSDGKTQSPRPDMLAVRYISCLCGDGVLGSDQCSRTFWLSLNHREVLSNFMLALASVCIVTS